MDQVKNQIVLNKDEALEAFFNAYSSDIEGTMTSMSKVELLEYLGSYRPEDNEGELGNIEDPENYSPDDIFVGCASAMTGIPEHDFLRYAVKHFGHA